MVIRSEGRLSSSGEFSFYLIPFGESARIVNGQIGCSSISLRFRSLKAPGSKKETLMRLLVVSTEFPPGPGGIGTHAYQISKHLQQLGWEVMVVTKQENAEDNAIRAFNELQPLRVITVKPQRLKALKFLHWLHK